MEALTNPIAALTMSSLEIAELTGKEHFHVMRDIRNMLDELAIDRSKFGSSYLNAQNKAQPCYALPKNLTITLVSGYSVVLRSRIVDRWLELEEATKPAAPAIPTTYVEALRLAADEAEKRMIAEAKAKGARGVARFLLVRSRATDFFFGYFGQGSPLSLLKRCGGGRLQAFQSRASQVPRLR